ncbi:hypothetical protein BWI93_17750 [Siphonobacter sp. BAB-5385]|uniref:DUF4132 domain-containing protein n=1 Tax=Siphonobacter sp. BAB-5385 TaxID=1864822 RepID=UPI000B9E13CC|nr:DUF4132 domain-containing protein [Siphonobacter sp. BAB-5385]OZI06842.1 hypothetical protein BWI93_17750 [Siphonobacter sp. BAB-5385]
MDYYENRNAAFFAEIANESEFERVIRELGKQYLLKKPEGSAYELKLRECPLYTQQVALWENAKKIAFVLHCLSTRTKGEHEVAFTLKRKFVSQIVKDVLVLDHLAIAQLWEGFKGQTFDRDSFEDWPLVSFFNTIVKQFRDKSLSPEERNVLAQLLKDQQEFDPSRYYYGYTAFKNDRIRIIDQLTVLLEKKNKGIAPSLFTENDGFAGFANARIESLPLTERELWYGLIDLAKRTSGSKPTKKFLSDSQVSIQKVGEEQFYAVIHSWFEFITNLRFVYKKVTDWEGITREQVDLTQFIADYNQGILKPLVWMCTPSYREKTVHILGAMAERLYQSLPGIGVPSVGLANACVYALSTMRGGVPYLSRLKLKLKKPSLRETVEKGLLAAAERQGVSIHEIQELSLEQYGLTAGKLTESFADYQATLTITGVGKSEITWLLPDGTTQQSVPAAIKDQHLSQLTQFKALQKQINQMHASQRGRLDQLFRAQCSWAFPAFRKYYLDHGLLSWLSRRLIWSFDDSQKKQSAFWEKEGWVNAWGEAVIPHEEARVSLWHPVLATAEEIRAWRTYMQEKQIVQPLKQAYREIYILTDAELRTCTYSNRMAAHLLKQHTFEKLAKNREWKYTLAGTFDNGHTGKAELKIPDFDLQADYYVHALENGEDSIVSSGVFKYIVTDHVLFRRISTRQNVELTDVPPVVFSEVMRDCDLFVGVCSIGNDPTWQDSGGMDEYRDYWQQYSFGALSESGINRREILANLLPRLKINKVAELQEKFLVVKGKLRTYKIHLGSTNILMEPNDQYLCIVADYQQKDPARGLYIPFEGDEGLSLLLSKAFLLAQDHKITDPSILSQINL